MGHPLKTYPNTKISGVLLIRGGDVYYQDEANIYIYIYIPLSLSLSLSPRGSMHPKVAGFLSQNPWKVWFLERPETSNTGWVGLLCMDDAAFPTLCTERCVSDSVLVQPREHGSELKVDSSCRNYPACMRGLDQIKTLEGIDHRCG